MIDKIKILASRTGFWVFLLSLALCLTVRSGHIYTPDEEILFRTAESFSNFTGGAIEPLGGYARVRNAQGEFVTVYQQGFGTRRGSGDLEYAQYGIGQPLLAVPLVWLGKAILPVLPASATETLQVQGIQYHDGSLRSYQLRHAVSHFNCLITALTVYGIFFLVRRIFENRSAAVAVALIYAGATMALPHSKTFLSEPLAGLCALASLAFAVKGFRSLENDSPSASNALALSGFCFGYAVLTRLDSLMFGPGLALYLVWNLWNRHGKNWRAFIAPLVRWGLPVAGCLALILLLNTIRFGSPLASGYSDQPEGVKFSTPLLVSLQGFLFSPGRSLFVFSPPLLLAPVGFFFLWKRDRILAASIATMILVFFLFQCKWQNWSGGWDWGPRHIFQLFALLCIPLAGVFEAPLRDAAWKRLPLLILVVLGIGVNVPGVCASFMDAYASIPAEVHRLTIYSWQYTLPKLHLVLMANGHWDLFLPRLLTAPALACQLSGLLVIAFLGFSGWGLYRNTRSK